MYLYLLFFNEETLKRGYFYLSENYLEPVKRIFPNYKNLVPEDIQGCIGLLKKKGNREKPCYLLQVTNISERENFFSLNFDIKKPLNITSGSIDRQLFALAKQREWVIDYIYPLMCIMDKESFDLVRKGGAKTTKSSSVLSEISELKTKNDWLGICNKFEPLEQLNKREDIMSNADLLFQIAFACSKSGEPRNGLERDKEHLKKIKRYRDLSIKFYKKCYEINPLKHQYASAIGYRYYANVNELTKPKGRRDGNVTEDINEGVFWLDKALKINPNSIKDNYRKGKLILEKQIKHLRYSNNNSMLKNHEINALEQEGCKCLEKVVLSYEELNSKSEKDYYGNEYVKTLYNLGKYYESKIQNSMIEFGIHQILGKDYKKKISSYEKKLLQRAKTNFEECFYAECELPLDLYLDTQQIFTISNDWAVSPENKFYRLGSINLTIYLSGLIADGDINELHLWAKKTEKFLRMSLDICSEFRKKGNHKNDKHIKEKLAWLYILNKDYQRAINLIQRYKDGYIKNTYAIVLMLSDNPERYDRAEKILKEACEDRNNLMIDTSKVLLALLYRISNNDKYPSYVNDIKEKLSKKGERLLENI